MCGLENLKHLKVIISLLCIERVNKCTKSFEMLKRNELGLTDKTVTRSKQQTVILSPTVIVMTFDLMSYKCLFYNI